MRTTTAKTTKVLNKGVLLIWLTVTSALFTYRHSPGDDTVLLPVKVYVDVAVGRK